MDKMTIDNDVTTNTFEESMGKTPKAPADSESVVDIPNEEISTG